EDAISLPWKDQRFPADIGPGGAGPARGTAPAVPEDGRAGPDDRASPTTSTTSWASISGSPRSCKSDSPKIQSRVRWSVSSSVPRTGAGSDRTPAPVRPPASPCARGAGPQPGGRRCEGDDPPVSREQDPGGTATWRR